MAPDNIAEIEVDCPDCGNRNRSARRRCMTCDRTGRVRKTLPCPAADR